MKRVYVFYGKASIAVRRRVANAGVFTFVSATSARVFQAVVTGDGIIVCRNLHDSIEHGTVDTFRLNAMSFRQNGATEKTAGGEMDGVVDDCV